MAVYHEYSIRLTLLRQLQFVNIIIDNFALLNHFYDVQLSRLGCPFKRGFYSI